jgi:hypothetical protein
VFNRSGRFSHLNVHSLQDVWIIEERILKVIINIRRPLSSGMLSRIRDDFWDVVPCSTNYRTENTWLGAIFFLYHPLHCHYIFHSINFHFLAFVLRDLVIFVPTWFFVVIASVV